MISQLYHISQSFATVREIFNLYIHTSRFFFINFLIKQDIESYVIIIPDLIIFTTKTFVTEFYKEFALHVFVK